MRGFTLLLALYHHSHRATPVVLVIAALAAITGCDAWPTSPSTGTEQESVVIAATAEFASRLHVQVRGELTDEVYEVNCNDGTRCPAAGWYSSGTAYYWRPFLITKGVEYARALAAHETCHALHHDEEGADRCAQELLL
jgi:hypothetical protein